MTDPAERDALVSALRSTGHEVIAIALAQVLEMAGNALEVLVGLYSCRTLC